MRREEIAEAAAPPDLEALVDGHLNTRRFLSRGWLRVTIVLAVGLPLALIARGSTFAGALFTAAVFCAIAAGLMRLGVHVLLQIRARQVATEIDRRVPEDHPGRESVERWLARRNRRGELDAVLQEWFGGDLRSEARTYTYTTTRTQVWKDGEWVEVEHAPEDASPEELLGQVDREQPSRASIPLSGGSASRRPAHLPLELEEFEPDDSPQPVGATRRGRTPA